MIETLEVGGLWWLPGEDAHHVAGTLRWHPDSGGELELHDRLHELIWEDHELPDGTIQKVRTDRSERHDYPVVHGKSGSDCYTLIDCFNRRLQENLFTGDATETVGVSGLLVGKAWFDDVEDLGMDRATITMRSLTSWVGLSGIEESQTLDPAASDVFVTLKAKRLPSIAIDDSAGKVRLTHGLRVHGDRSHGRAIDQKWRLALEYPDLRPLDDLMAKAGDVQALITIASGAAADIEQVSFEHPEATYVSGDRERRLPFEYLIQWPRRSDSDDDVEAHNFLFNLADFGSDEGLARWLPVAEQYRSEIGRAMATRHSMGMYVEDRIMNVCGALESFDKERRQTGKWTKLKTRLIESITFVGEPANVLLGGDTEVWAENARDRRDEIAHHKLRVSADRTKSDFVLSERLFWLLAFGVLKLSDVPDSVFDSILNHRKVEWLKHEAV